MRRNLIIPLISLSSAVLSRANWFKQNLFSIHIATSSSSSFTTLTNNNHNHSSTFDINNIKSAEEYEKEFKVIKNETAYSGWRKIIRREVINPNGKSTIYDIVSQSGGSIGVFPWNTVTSTTTLIREYHPGVGKFQYGVIGGMFESKHTTSLECAQFELEEEAQLKSDTWIPLLSPSPSSSSSDTLTTTSSSILTNGPVSFDKYSDNVLYPYIALDCQHVDIPRAPDDDEYIVIEKNITYKRLWEIISTGQMNIFSSYVTMSALRKLEEMGYYIDKTN